MGDQSAWHKWHKGTGDELEFWQQWLQTQGREWPEDFQSRLDPTVKINERRIAEYIKGTDGQDVSILDVGAGPLSSLGKVFPGKSITITATDPLADEYNRVMSELGIVPPVRTISCEGERLLDLFEPESFDIAYARNALDHSHDPLRVIRNMVSLIKSTGLVFLRHFSNEAVQQGNVGLHQWNFDVRDGALVVWNESQVFDVASCLGSQAQVLCYYEGDAAIGPPWVVAEITKRHD